MTCSSTRIATKLWTACLGVAATLVISLAGPSAHAQDWSDIVAAARGETVFFNAWAGSPKINDYIQWVAEQVDARYGVELRHVKIDDTAQVVTRVLAERTAGRDTRGSVDLVWINGENFAAMKGNDLLGAPFADGLPNFALIDTVATPTAISDFTVATGGRESPWGMAQLVFVYDTDRLTEPPRSAAALLDWAQANSGRLTYPQPPNFTGTTFLKQIMLDLAGGDPALSEPVTDASFAQVTAPLWQWLEAITPHLWREGKAYPANRDVLIQLLDDGEIDIAMTFEPAGASAAIEQGLLPDTVRTFIFDRGTIGNSHFVAIPYNSSSREAAMVVANFLLSPEAQARKQDPSVWGDFSVLSVDRLTPSDARLFADIPRGIATLAPADLTPTLAEPHPSWVGRLEAEWQRRIIGSN